MSTTVAHSFFSEFDVNLFKSGTHYRLYEKFGAHTTMVDGVAGTYFAVWAPAAKSVSVVGDFNYWTEGEHLLNVRWDKSGIWEGFIPGATKGDVYKYKIQSHLDVKTEKVDPYARRCEHPPKTGSVIWDDDYYWQDKTWMRTRKKHNALDAPFAVYEVHLGSWKKKVAENRSLSYLEHADELVSYCKEMQFTHVEIMPIMEHPYDPSWGYQITGYFAPTARFGYPEEFKSLIDKLHQNNIGVILDWVPSHFPEDAHGLGGFDGTCLYEHPDEQKGYHPDWKSLIFNYGRNEVRSFLISNAIFWLDQYHIDGLRVDAVASMLYLDYSREKGEWQPNIYGGREYLEAISFLKELNKEVYASFPDVQTIAEESTSFPMVSKPTYLGGLGFGMKWMMGWMHDTLHYIEKKPIHRWHHQNELTFSMTYAFSENFMLPLSHDEVVHGKRSLLGRMPGDEWQQFANFRLLYSFMYTHPGTNLIFMGGEFAQREEWKFGHSLDWHLLQYEYHSGVQKLVRELNILYRTYPALYQKQFSSDGFEWISHEDTTNSVITYVRYGHLIEDTLVIACNFTPVPRKNYTIGLPEKVQALYQIFNSDDKKYGGSGYTNSEKIKITNTHWNNRSKSAEICIPPLGAVIFSIKNECRT
ncbi:1,4-alpha-glucan branching protein GlgB [Aquimarina sp. U1-2]|uniref:1,4-alpha-glucan branching protein GlgB n=1 Tax=Aquimarina sp. U1-2 TaxID=2823141 RepID=UPI001AEC9347|nr:1,4-alpha-glucan branching protein GlgB [Aquimarina sp. U1-2]MBP2831906.1 1,4-alpha-glucan branching protein GlgB [Aquimarina sp. U1-2]